MAFALPPSDENLTHDPTVSRLPRRYCCGAQLRGCNRAGQPIGEGLAASPTQRCFYPEGEGPWPTVLVWDRHPQFAPRVSSSLHHLLEPRQENFALNRVR
jgi:hypothetical protein